MTGSSPPRSRQESKKTWANKKKGAAKIRKDSRKTADSRKNLPRSAAFQERKVNHEGHEIITIFGLHAVLAALENPKRKINKLLMSENAQRRLSEAIVKRGVDPETTTPKTLDRILGADTVHQGVLLETLALEAPKLEDLVDVAQKNGPIVVLDQVTDPHNVGAVLRSCAVFGSAGLIMTRRNSPALSGVLAKSASGALELVPVHLCANLSRTLAALKEHGIEVIGLEGEADEAIEDIKMTGSNALVFGAEGKGLRQLTSNTCSQLARIHTQGSLASLNVSNAAAVTLHLAAMRRRGV